MTTDLVVEAMSWLLYICAIDLVCFIRLSSIYGDKWRGTEMRKLARIPLCAISALLLYWLGRNPPKESNAPGE